MILLIGFIMRFFCPMRSRIMLELTLLFLLLAPVALLVAVNTRRNRHREANND